MSDPAAPRRVALVGSPNAGKTSLFNALTGLRKRVGNYPGVTVERVEGDARIDDHVVTIVDLPGTYALEPLSADEQVTVDVLDGRLGDGAKPDGILLVADATTLERSLPMIAEVLARGEATAVALTMIDELKARGGTVRRAALEKRLGVPVVGVVGHRGLGLDDLRDLLRRPDGLHPSYAKLPTVVPADDDDVPAHYAWASEVYAECVVPPERGTAWTDRLDRILLHPVAGLAVFFVAMLAFFETVFTLAAPLQDLFESAVLTLGEYARGALPDGLVESLVVDGIVAGVGGVVVFIPQIALLLLLIALMEGTGYMARAAFLVDRVMGWAGLEGRSFIALLSSFACAVPGIMAARSVPDPKTRLATILVAPLMTCSARLPVYALLIGAFVPAERVFGIFNLQGLTLFGLYLLGGVSGLIGAKLLQRGLRTGRTLPFYMELPPFRVPGWRVVRHQVGKGVGAFLRKAGTIILVASVALWALLTFPEAPHEPDVDIGEAVMVDTTPADPGPVAYTDSQVAYSYAGRLGRAFEPAIEPLGFDWKIGIGLIASFAAREVIVSALSQIYAFDGDEDDLVGLGERMRVETDADGAPVYTLATALSLLVFFVFALQCVSTLAIMRRETNSWRWPIAAFVVLTIVAWTASFVTYQVASALGA